MVAIMVAVATCWHPNRFMHMKKKTCESPLKVSAL